MLKEVPLETTKYVTEAVDRQYKEHLQKRSNRGFNLFALVLSAAACFFIGLLIAQQVQHWAPILGL